MNLVDKVGLASSAVCSLATDLAHLPQVQTVKATLYGSLAATGKGHMTPEALLLGLEGSTPETIE